MIVPEPTKQTPKGCVVKNLTYQAIISCSEDKNVEAFN